VTLEQRDRARVQLERALTLFQSLGRHVDAADTLLVLGINAQSVTESAAAAQYYSRALETLNHAGKETPPALLFRVKVYLAGVLLMNFHRVGEARALLDQAIALAARDPHFPPDQLSGALQHRGTTMLEEGRFDEAEALFRQAIATNRYAFDAWVMLAHLSFLKENFSAAAEFMRHDYELAASYGLEDKAEVEVMWARYRAEAGEVPEALSQIREALPRVRKYARHGYLSGYFLEASARVFSKAGRFEEAARAAREALDAFREDRIPETHPLTAALMEDLGVALGGLKRNREAITALEKAVELYEQLGPAYGRTADRVRRALAAVKG
jgi:tetratricopeptide (TPR) repeat protein